MMGQAEDPHSEGELAPEGQDPEEGYPGDLNKIKQLVQGSLKRTDLNNFPLSY